MERCYPALIHKEKKSLYGISFPDFPGCVSAGETEEESLISGREALQLCIDTMFEMGEKIPAPGSVKDDWLTTKCKDIISRAIVPVEIPQKSVRINISIADHILSRIDNYARKHGESRSALLAHAASEYISHAQ